MAVSSVAERLAVPAFILVWASGYVVAKLAAADAEPLSFLVLRYAGVCALMLVLALAGGAKWPNRRDAFHIAAAGVLIQALYLGGVWVAIRMGLSAGAAALLSDQTRFVGADARSTSGIRLTSQTSANS